MKKKIIMVKKKTEVTTVGQAFDAFIKKCKVDNLSDYTILAYQKKCAEFVTMLGADNPVTDIDIDAIQDYILDLRDRDITDTTVATIVRHIRAFVYYCQERGWVPHFKVTVPKADKKVKETYTVDELNTLLKRPNVKKCSFSEYKTWAFENYLLATGNRLATALNVKIGDVNFDENTIYLCRTKSRKEQIIPLSSELASILKEYLEIRGGESGDYLFCNEYGDKASDRTYQQLVRRYNTKRNVEKTSIHVFRHTFAKQWVLAHGDIARLQKIMGHASLTTTNEYLHMFGVDLQKDFDRFNPLDNLKGRR